MKTAGIIIAIVIVAVAGVYLISRSGNKSSTSSDSTYNGASDNAQGTEKGVMLNSVDMPKSGFIVIQADNNGQPGSILGVSSYLSQGTNNNVTVPGNLAPGTNYFVTVYEDTNGNHTFDPNTDTPMKDSSNNIIRQQFTVPTSGSTSGNPGINPGANSAPAAGNNTNTPSGY